MSDSSIFSKSYHKLGLCIGKIPSVIDSMFIAQNIFNASEILNYETSIKDKEGFLKSTENLLDALSKFDSYFDSKNH